MQNASVRTLCCTHSATSVAISTIGERRRWWAATPAAPYCTSDSRRAAVRALTFSSTRSRKAVISASEIAPGVPFSRMSPPLPLPSAAPPPSAVAGGGPVLAAPRRPRLPAPPRARNQASLDGGGRPPAGADTACTARCASSRSRRVRLAAGAVPTAGPQRTGCEALAFAASASTPPSAPAAPSCAAPGWAGTGCPAVCPCRFPTLTAASHSALPSSACLPSWLPRARSWLAVRFRSRFVCCWRRCEGWPAGLATAAGAERGGFHSTNDLGPCGEPSSLMTATSATPSSSCAWDSGLAMVAEVTMKRGALL
mmetsp:Transcript_6397/g.16553  ORF Transcript_6397/g.16553 Transcript_6397/m.16553 type:complete len:311 (-) Transcript_6397:886-1818(-)